MELKCRNFGKPPSFNNGEDFVKGFPPESNTLTRNVNTFSKGARLKVLGFGIGNGPARKFVWKMKKRIQKSQVVQRTLFVDILNVDFSPLRVQFFFL